MIFESAKASPHSGKGVSASDFAAKGLNPAAEDTLYIEYSDIQRFLFAVLFEGAFVSVWKRFHGRIDALLREQ